MFKRLDSASVATIRTSLSLIAEGVIRGESGFPVSVALMIALSLISLGFFAALSLILGIGPFR
jgi:hypothetical protein